MRQRTSTYAFLLALVLLLGGSALADDCCKADRKTPCCCAAESGAEKPDCTPQMCADLDTRPLETPYFSPSQDLSCLACDTVVGIVDDVHFKVQRVVRPKVTRERAPPPLFADHTLCFLPPPAVL